MPEQHAKRRLAAIGRLGRAADVIAHTKSSQDEKQLLDAVHTMLLKEKKKPTDKIGKYLHFYSTRLMSAYKVDEINAKTQPQAADDMGYTDPNSTTRKALDSLGASGKALVEIVHGDDNHPYAQKGVEFNDAVGLKGAELDKLWASIRKLYSENTQLVRNDAKADFKALLVEFEDIPKFDQTRVAVVGVSVVSVWPAPVIFVCTRKTKPKPHQPGQSDKN